MRERRSTYSVSFDPETVWIVDEDVGFSVTNDAEAVVEDLRGQGLLEGRRVIYRDSDGRWDELLVQGGSFAGFGTISAEDRARAEARHAP